jgi:hypothetical protein
MMPFRCLTGSNNEERSDRFVARWAPDQAVRLWAILESNRPPRYGGGRGGSGADGPCRQVQPNWRCCIEAKGVLAAHQNGEPGP